MMKKIVAPLLALGVLIGIAGQVLAAVENDNRSSFDSAKEYYERLERTGAGG